VSGPTWEDAWYPLMDKYVKVETVLKVRDRNRGEYRENPCYHDKISYKNGYGIALFPRKEGSDGKRAHFARYSHVDNERAMRKLSENIGMSGSNTTNYINSVLRVSTMIRNINRALTDDLIPEMNIKSCERTNRMSVNDPLSIPDFIITHNPTKDNPHPNPTKLFIQEINRKPNFEINEEDDWILKITKWEMIQVMEWDKAKELFMKEWGAFKQKYRKKKLTINQPAPKWCMVLLGYADVGGHRSTRWRGSVPFGRPGQGNPPVLPSVSPQSVTLRDLRRVWKGMSNDIHLTSWTDLPPGTPIIIGEKFRSKYRSHLIIPKTRVHFYAELLDYPKISLPKKSLKEFRKLHTEFMSPSVLKFKGRLSQKAWNAYKKDDIEEYTRICKKAGFEPYINVTIDIKWSFIDRVIREGPLSKFTGFRKRRIENVAELVGWASRRTQ